MEKFVPVIAIAALSIALYNFVTVTMHLQIGATGSTVLAK